MGAELQPLDVCGALALSETFEALVAGLQGALWALGAVPGVLRHDNLSAATHELKRNGCAASRRPSGEMFAALKSAVEADVDAFPDGRA